MADGALIVGACAHPGAEPFYRALIEAAPLVIAADGGVDLCLACGRVPDICVGDFDSVSPGALREARDAGSEIITFPADKDESDLDLALAIALDRTRGPVTLTAAFSGRMDHTLAALGTLVRGSAARARAVEPCHTVYALDAGVRPSIGLRLPPGTVVSVFAVQPGSVATVIGVRYELKAEPLEVWSSRGLSNIATSPDQSVTADAGCLLVLVNEPEYTRGGTVDRPEDR